MIKSRGGQNAVDVCFFLVCFWHVLRKKKISTHTWRTHEFLFFVIRRSLETYSFNRLVQIASDSIGYQQHIGMEKYNNNKIIEQKFFFLHDIIIFFFIKKGFFFFWCQHCKKKVVLMHSQFNIHYQQVCLDVQNIGKQSCCLVQNRAGILYPFFFKVKQTKQKLIKAFGKKNSWEFR